MKTIKTLWIGASLIVLTVSCTPKEKDPVIQQDIHVQVAEIKVTEASTTVFCSGLLSSRKMSKLSFKTGGIINRIFVEEGAQVRKGQLLASLNLTEISAQVQQSLIGFEKAERDWIRAKNLYADSVITLEQLQNATTAYQAALEVKNISEFNQRYSQIVAPANGIIISKMAEENELTAPGVPVIVFSELGSEQWVLKTGVSDKDFVAIKKHDKATVVFDAFANREFEGIVTHLSEMADPVSGTFEIELTVNPGSAKFINGMVASAKIYSSEVKPVTLLPAHAVTETNGNRGYVYLVNPQKPIARRVPVTISHILNNEIAVLEPLNNMGMVVTKGAAYLEDGSSISIRN